MRKGIVSVILALLLLVPTVLTGCQQETEIEEVAANVYTLYTIVDESTTPEAIVKVELALNRILFYRLGYCLKLVAVPADEYESLIDAKFEEMEAYTLAKKNKSKKKDTSADASAESSADESTGEDESSQVIMTGDRILESLENGEEIVLENPRLDIFLVQGYDRYKSLASQGKLAALDEKLNNEAKALKSSIHSTLFTAAKVNNKTYGIPVNNAIGQYTYLIFDKELLQKYSMDQNTLKSMEDLQDYLGTIKENEPDVVPLKDSFASTEINFLSNDGFPAIINNAGEVVDAYSNKNLTKYLSMIARYNSLGYFESDNAASEPRYAVRIESGNIDELKSSLEGDGREYEFSLYSNPIATNENTIDNIFCVSKYVVSNELTEVMKIVAALNTDAELMNILTYGVENEHYILNDYGQVERLNNDYIIDPKCAGNAFITKTLAGEPKDKWEKNIKQNQETVVAKTLGYTMELTAFTYTEKVKTTTKDEEGNEIEVETEVEKEIHEPNYVEIINTVVDKYYPGLMRGNAIDIDYDELRKQAEDEVKQEFINKIDKLYKENILNPAYGEKIRSQVVAKRSKQIKEEAERSIIEEYLSLTKRKLKTILTAQYKEENPDLSADDIEAMVNETLTEEYINEQLYIINSEEEIKAEIDDMYDYILDDEVTTAINEAVGTPEYEREFEKLKQSAQYKKDLDDMLTYDAPAETEARFDELIAVHIAEYTDNMKVEMNDAIKTEIEKFIADNKETLKLTDNQILCKIGFLEEEIVETPEGEESTEEKAEGEEGEDEPKEPTYKPKYESEIAYFDFVFTEKCLEVYYKIFGVPDGL